MPDDTATNQGWVKIGITAALILGGWVASHVRLEARLNGHVSLSDQKNETQDVAIARIDQQGSQQLNNYSSTLKTLENDVKHLTTSLVELKADWKAGQARIEDVLMKLNTPTVE